MLEERGEYYATDDDDDDTRSVVSKSTALALGGRRASLLAAAAALPGARKVGVVKERERRKARIELQTAAMQGTMADVGWQAMIVKSSKMFDALMSDFMGG